MTHRDALTTSKRVRKNGETNPVTVLLGLAFVGVCYYVYFVGPLYLDNLEAKEAAAEGFNVYFNKGEEAARTAVLFRLNVQSPDFSHLEVDENGVEVTKPGFGLVEENVDFIFDEPTGQLRVRISYDRTVDFKPFKKRKTYHLVAEKVGKQAK